MRKRYQKGSLKNIDGSWIAQWWEDGHRRKRTLGRVKDMTKTRAKTSSQQSPNRSTARKKLFRERHVRRVHSRLLSSVFSPQMETVNSHDERRPDCASSDPGNA